MWDERYRREDYVYGKAPNDFLAARVDELRPGNVLCLAEGEGRNAVFLAGRGFDVSAVDASAVGLEKAGRLAAEHGVEIEMICADLADYDLGKARWDNIVSIYCHVLSPLRADVHRRVTAALRPGGVFLLEGYTPRQLAFHSGGPRDPDRLMSSAILARELEGLEFRRLEELERDIYEGSHHSGRSAVVQVVATKP